MPALPWLGMRSGGPHLHPYFLPGEQGPRAVEEPAHQDYSDVRTTRLGLCLEIAHSPIINKPAVRVDLYQEVHLLSVTGRSLWGAVLTPVYRIDKP